MLAALLLEVLGVDRDHVLDDFHLSEQLHGLSPDTPGFDRMIAMGMPPEAAAGALGAPKDMLAGVLDRLDAEHGGAERYLVEMAGVSEDSIERLRAALLSG